MIESVAFLKELKDSRLTVERPAAFDDVKIGSSISVSGVCLTIVELSKAEMHFDLTEETLRRTKLKNIHKGDKVNVERAMKADARLEGHIVQGHVEGVGRVVRGEGSGVEEASEETLVLELPTNLLPFVVPKGSIAIDGVSLTVAKLEESKVMVALIPHTMEHTTLGSLKKGDRVNVETDILSRHADKLRMDTREGREP